MVSEFITRRCRAAGGNHIVVDEHAVVRGDGVALTSGRPEAYEIELPDGRVKRSRFCPRCATRLFGPSSAPGLAVVEPGTLDDTSWLRPVGHIWTRSAQPWLRLPEDSLRFPAAPSQEEMLSMVRAWKERAK